MLVLVLAILLGLLAWLVVKKTEHVDPAIRRAAIACAIGCVLAVLAVRAGPVGIGLLVIGLVVVWLRMRGRGGGGGDDGRDPPDEPEPDPGPREEVRPERVEDDALDRARSEWERELPKR